jgi:hypothetical protein
MLVWLGRIIFFYAFWFVGWDWGVFKNIPTFFFNSGL